MNGISESRGSADEGRYAQAAGWYLRIREAEIHGPELSAEEFLEWDRFFASPENRDALDLAIGVSSQFDQRRGQAGMMPECTALSADETYDPSMTVKEWLSRRSENEAASVPTRRSRGWWTFAGLALAAGLGVLTIGLGRGYLQAIDTPESPRLFSTLPGEHKDVILSDGSTVTLGGRTEISVQYATGRRTIGLVHGEAVFAVARDPRRPFTVLAGAGTITALGTQFDVRRDLDRVTVTVTEGTVLVEPSDATTSARKPMKAPAYRWHPVRLDQGQEVTYGGEKTRASSVEHADPAATEWKAGRLQYRDVPLKYVVADVNRYRDQEIVLQDGAAADYEFTGTVFRDRISEWALSLEKIFPLQVRHDGPRIVIQCRRPITGSDTRCSPK